MQASSILAAILVATSLIAIKGQPPGFGPRKVTFQCGDARFFNGVESIHSNANEDRDWKFGCSVYLGRFTSCTWTSWLNDYDGVLTYSCPENSSVAGYQSIYGHYAKDRRTKLKCCTNGRYKQRHCRLTDWVNAWDGKMAYWEPAKHNKVISGWHSVHSNWYEDRRHKFRVCNYK